MKNLKFIVRQSDGNPIEANYTYLIGEITASYEKLRTKFGHPNNGDGYKTDVEWTIKFEDGTIATIYNWKDGKSYKGKDGLDVKDITNWHIGGYNGKALTHIVNCL